MKRNRLSVGAGIIAGLLAGPAIALGMSGVFAGDAATTSTTAEAVAAEAAAPATTSTLPPTTTTTRAAASDEDLAAACGPDGLDLVAAEEAGTATDLELAALDALRDVCTEAGMPLPDPEPLVAAAAPEIIVYETVEAPAPAVAPITTVPRNQDDDGEYEHEEHDGERYEDEHDEHEEHEDDEHEEDD